MLHYETNIFVLILIWKSIAVPIQNTTDLSKLGIQQFILFENAKKADSEAHFCSKIHFRCATKIYSLILRKVKKKFNL